MRRLAFYEISASSGEAGPRTWHDAELEPHDHVLCDPGYLRAGKLQSL